MDAVVEFLRNFWNNLALGQLQHLGNWNYVLLALLVLIEGPIATLLGAVAAASGLLNPYLVFVAASIGNLTADTLWYLLGYSGRIEWLVEHGRWLGIRRSHIEQLQRDMHAHATKIIFLAKITASFSIPALIAAGLTRVPWRKTFSVVFVGECIWTGGLVIFGYHYSASLKRLEAGLQVLIALGTIVFLALILRYVHKHFAREWALLNHVSLLAPKNESPSHTEEHTP